MPCLLCGADDANHRIVHSDSASVEGSLCEHCAEAHFSTDDRGPTCELCGELADFDLAHVDPDSGELPADGDELDVVARDIICAEDLNGLKETTKDAA